MTFQDWFKNQLEIHKLTRRSAAELAQVAASTCQQWCDGETVPKIQNLWRFCFGLYTCPQAENHFLQAAKLIAQETQCGHTYIPNRSRASLSS